MLRSHTAPAAIRWRSLGLAYCLLAAGAILAPAQSTNHPAPLAHSDLYRHLKDFDFNERPLGNFSDTPMYWRRLAGPGLPTFSSGQFDDHTGHEAPPSFRFDIHGGSVAYEYAHTDLTVSAESDYVIEGYIRAEDLEFASALLMCHLVDESGALIEGSRRVSTPINSQFPTDGRAEPWQPFRVTLLGEYPDAHALRIQLWVLQNHAFRELDEAIPDPIIRQEVNARVWFDDITIIRMPRVRMWFSNPGGLVKPGASESCHVAVHNATLAPLTTAVRVEDDQQHVYVRQAYPLEPRATEHFEIAIPRVPPGLYQAYVSLQAGDEVLSERSIRFAVLPEVFSGEAHYAELGVDLGRWPGGGLEGAADLIATLGCGAVKVGLPMMGAPSNDDEVTYLREVRDLARFLALNQIETTGTILSEHQANPTNPDPNASTLRMLQSDPDWNDLAGPIFAYFGGYVFSWQLGNEPIELASSIGWSADTIDELREKLRRFLSVPQLVIPRHILDVGPASWLYDLLGMKSQTADTGAVVHERVHPSQRPHAYSFWVPAEIPASAIPWQLAFWLERENEARFQMFSSHNPDDPGPDRWLSLSLRRDRSLPLDIRLMDMARRIVLAAAAGPDRVYVPAPFQLTQSGGQPHWQPTDEYVPLRTLMHHLSGKRAIATLPLDDDAVGILFGQHQRHTLVIWTWQQGVASRRAHLYVGPGAYAVELDGTRQALRRRGALATIPLRACPLIVENVDAPLLLLQNSFQIEPRFIQLHDPEPRPVLTLTNHYDEQISGLIELNPPATWHVAPSPMRVTLAPGETYRQVLDVKVPPRTIASEQDLGIHFKLQSPRPVEMEFAAKLRIGLKDIDVAANAWWEGADVIVQQTLRNLTPNSISFSAFCQPPRRALLEGLFLDVLPGEVRVLKFRVKDADDLAGEQVWLGVQEVNGRRSLDQLVQIPD